MFLKVRKTLQNRLWSHTPKPILFFLRGISMIALILLLLKPEKYAKFLIYH